MTYTDNRASRTNNLCVCLSPPHSPPPYPFPSSPVSSSFLTSSSLAQCAQLTPLTAYVTIHSDIFSLHCTACLIHPVTPVFVFFPAALRWMRTALHPSCGPAARRWPRRRTCTCSCGRTTSSWPAASLSRVPSFPTAVPHPSLGQWREGVITFWASNLGYLGGWGGVAERNERMSGNSKWFRKACGLVKWDSDV